MDWLWSENRFVLFDRYHLGALLLTLAASGLALWAGRRLRGQSGQFWLSRSLAVMLVVAVCGRRAMDLDPDTFDVRFSLPLQICDAACFVGVYALWTLRRWAAAVVYYWGLTFTLLASITPDLSSGFPNLHFIAFFAWHAMVIVMAVYLVWGVGLYPTWRHYRLTCLATFCYATSLYLLNSVLGSNYMFVNRLPERATLLDLLGPHPVYVVIGILLCLLVWAAMTWPWQWIGGMPPEVRLPKTHNSRHR
ncbi:MAG: TIGR02206 family membrane protein [Planctomycetota bacterium]